MSSYFLVSWLDNTYLHSESNCNKCCHIRYLITMLTLHKLLLLSYSINLEGHGQDCTQAHCSRWDQCLAETAVQCCTCADQSLSSSSTDPSGPVLSRSSQAPVIDTSTHTHPIRVTIVWTIREEIIRTVLCCIVHKQVIWTVLTDKLVRLVGLGFPCFFLNYGQFVCIMATVCTYFLLAVHLLSVSAQSIEWKHLYPK